MSRAGSLTRDEWPEWTINQTTPPVITLEGHNLQAVFSMIHTQLETLRRITIEQNKIIIENTKKDEKNNEKNIKTIIKLQERIEKLEHDLKEGESGQLLEKLKSAEERINYLEKQIDLKESSEIKDIITYNNKHVKENENHIYELQYLLKSVNLHDITEKLKKYEAQMNLLELEKFDTHSRIVKMEDHACWYRNQADKMNEEVVKLFENNEVTAREIREFRDLLLNYENNRDNHAERSNHHSLQHGNSSNNNNINNTNNSNNNYMQSTMTPFQENIIQSELNKLSSLLSNLDHKYSVLNQQFHEIEDSTSNKLDKKIDWIKSWIIKYLRDYLALNQDDRGGSDQTDIGKVRCLVCNHVTKKIDPDTPYTKPDFKNTLGYLHDNGGGITGAGLTGTFGIGTGAHGNTNGTDDNGMVYRAGFKIPLKDHQESYKLKSMLSPNIVSNANANQQQQQQQQLFSQSQKSGNGGIVNGSKFARIRAVPTGAPNEYIFEDDPRIDPRLISTVDITQDTIINNIINGESRPKTSDGKDKGVNSNFYKEMERRYIRPSSAPGKKFRQGVR